MESQDKDTREEFRPRRVSIEKEALAVERKKYPKPALPIQILFFSIGALKPKINSLDSFRGSILK